MQVRKGDFTTPETLDVAFEGADKLLIVSYPSIAHEIRVKSHTAAIDAAKRVGVKHIYYTSLAFAGDSKATVMQAHIDTEAYLRACGITYTIIREGIYNESYPLHFGWFDPSEGRDEVLIPYSDGGIAWVCRDDLGLGTAKILAAVSRIWDDVCSKKLTYHFTGYYRTQDTKTRQYCCPDLKRSHSPSLRRTSPKYSLEIAN